MRSCPATTNCLGPFHAGPARACTRGLALLLAGVLALAVRPGRGPAAEPPPGQQHQDLASPVRAGFSARCAECHGADLRRPRGHFGYVLDLGRVAGNPKLVLPFSPEGSKLWTLLRDGDMPPEDSPGGPLSAAEKEAVRSWIAAGAPTAPAPPTAGPPSPTAAAPEGRTSGPGETASGKRALRWLGKLHIPLIHFPVALLLAAALGELW